MKTDWRLIDFIKQFREQHGNLDKVKIKLFLDEYAINLGVNPISAFTIGKNVRRYRFFPKPSVVKRKYRFPKLTRLNKTPKVVSPGYLEMDSITIYLDGQKHTFVSVIDIFTKYAFAAMIKTTSKWHQNSPRKI